MKVFFLMIMLIWCFCGTIAQSVNDSLQSIQNELKDSSQKKYDKIINRVFSQNKFVNLSSSSGNFINKEKGIKNKDVLFYILTTTLLMLGIFKIFYSRYFYNIFRVFFNTSLRQNQLTDMLLQAKLPSLIFNIFFMISGGIYIWSLLNYYHLFKAGDNIAILTICILALGLVYLGKFFSLKFIGWLTGMKQESDSYIFITFLVNKIIGVVLIPFTVIVIFGTIPWVNTAVIISLFISMLLFLSRYSRSYRLLQNNLKLNWFHFVVYIAAIEIIPMLIIYKAGLNFLS